MTKKFSCLIFLVLALIFSCGFKAKEKPYITFTSQNFVTEQTLRANENIFNVGSKITYMFCYPKGFGDSVLRMQLYKMDDKVQIMGFSLVQSRDVNVNIGDKQYMDYFILRQPGLYQLQIVEIRKQRRILQYARFRVVE